MADIDKESLDYFAGVVGEKFKSVEKTITNHNSKMESMEQAVNKMTLQVGKMDSMCEARLGICKDHFTSVDKKLGTFLDPGVGKPTRMLGSTRVTLAANGTVLGGVIGGMVYGLLSLCGAV